MVTAQVSREYPLYQPANGWAEQDPEDWRNAVFSAVRELMERSQAEPEQVMGIGFSGQMHGLVMLDENGKPIRRSIIWCDQRSAAQTQEMCSLMPEEKWLEITANPPIAAWTAAKILWMRKEEPENWEKVPTHSAAQGLYTLLSHWSFCKRTCPTRRECSCSM